MGTSAFFMADESLQTPQKVFDCYSRGDLDELARATDERFGAGTFRSLFPPAGKQ
ncbi:MAG: hypothetical protein QW568_02610 [Candidatus Anstonellaceae archaeon]